MENQPLTALNMEQLEKRKDKLTGISYSFIGLLLILIGLNIKLYFEKGLTASMVMPFAMMPIVIMNFKNLKNVKTEIVSRRALNN